MTTRSMSPRRRHILSSINPQIAPARSPRRSRTPPPPALHSAFPNQGTGEGNNAGSDAGTPLDNEHEHQREDHRRRRRSEENAENGSDGEHHRKRTSKFRFKSKSSKSSSSRHYSSSRRNRGRDYDRTLEEEDRGEQDGLEPRLGRDPDRGGLRDPAASHGRDSADRDRSDNDRGEDSTSSRRHGHRHHHRRHRRDDDDDDRKKDEDDNGSGRHRHHHRHKRRRHRRHEKDRTRSPTPPNPHEPPPLDPEAAFRESLFDAMADDEGAAYWEAVYGQPIHVYTQPSILNPQGELEQMDEEEYAAHVRQRMWEKTHEGLLEERARREELRRQKDKERGEAARLTREMERSLRRGEERRRKRVWQDKWERYIEGWEKWSSSNNNNHNTSHENEEGGGSGSGGGGGSADVDSIPWPVESGRQADIEASAVREFFVTAIDPTDVGEAEYLARLKNERVRWHPDKIQQRLGGKVDETVMRNVTAVFQVVDKLWSDARSASKPT